MQIGCKMPFVTGFDTVLELIQKPLLLSAPHSRIGYMKLSLGLKKLV